MHASRTASAGHKRLPSIRIRPESRRSRARLLFPLLSLSLIPALAAEEANTFFSASTESSPAAADKPLIPVISGEWWRVAGNPDLGELTGERQEPVDFAVWQAADGSWQLWSCIRHTKEPGKTRLFHRWEGDSLTTPDWRPLGIAMRGNGDVGETHGGMQAPYVFRLNGRYEMFYGSWQNICRAYSTDGKNFERLLIDGLAGVFGDGPRVNARDAMVIRIDGMWHCYYTAHPDKVGGVYCRRSMDMRDWSPPVLVKQRGRQGDRLWSHECPHVVPIEGWIHLFTTQRYHGEPSTTVFASRDPLHFGIDDDRLETTTLSAAAPEIIHHEGEWYIAALTTELDGIRIARMQWHPAP
jgi:hypothetical protein